MTAAQGSITFGVRVPGAGYKSHRCENSYEPNQAPSYR
jgi:hypothetical protein